MKYSSKAFRRSWIVLCAVLVCAGVICLWLNGNRPQPVPPSTSEPPQSSSQPAPPVSSAPVLDNPIPFGTLKEQNSDIYAWIQVPGTVIDYPVLQHSSDDSFYLGHDADRNYSIDGSIYTERNYNNQFFTDPSTLVYGHNMLAGNMFAALHKFADPDFFKENQSILIYTPDQKLEYEIFAAYLWSDEHLMYTYDFKNREVYTAYLNTVLSQGEGAANIRKDTKVDADSRIITLSTCDNYDDKKRFLVQGVLVKETKLKDPSASSAQSAAS